MCSGLRPTTSSSSCTILRRLPLGATSLWISNGSATMSPTVIRGFSDEYGSCRTIWMLRRTALSALPDSWAISSPWNRIWPAVGFSRRISSRAVVDLPQPDSPTTPRVSPLKSFRSIPSTACTAPTCFLNRMPFVRGKCLTSPRTSRTGSSGLDAAIEGLLPEVACAAAAARDVLKCRDLLEADGFLCVGAARVERTASRDLRQVRRDPFDRVELLALEVHPGDRGQQPLGVRVCGVAVERDDGCLLDQAPGVHHRDLVGDVGHDPQVVADVADKISVMY